MIIGPLSKDSVMPLSISSMSVECVLTYKLLGIIINTSLKWDDHIDANKIKAAKRLWFLKTLKWAGVTVDDLAHYYQNSCKTSLGICMPSMTFQY